MEDEPSDTAPKGQDSPEGVFGNLPSSRPGSRSPRRRDSRASADTAAETRAASEPAAPKPKPKPKPKAPTAPEAAKPSPEPASDPLEPQPGIHGVEDLAWAGVAVVAQAATAGIRFTSRALEAARKSIDGP